MKKIISVILLLICTLTWSACDDFERNIDVVTYKTLCTNKQNSNFFTIVVLPEDTWEKEEVDEEVIIGVYNDKEYYFESSTVYNYYRVEVNGYKCEYFPILEAITKHDYILEFMIDWCENSSIHDNLLSRELDME